MSTKAKVLEKANACLKLLPKDVEAKSWTKYFDAIMELGTEAANWKLKGGPEKLFKQINTLKHLCSNLANKAKRGELDKEKDGAEIATALNSIRSLPKAIENEPG